MEELIIRNGRCVTPSAVVPDAIVHVRRDEIVYIGPESNWQLPAGARIMDAHGDYVCPGFIDLQVNGGDGSDVLDGTDTAFRTITDYHARYGTTSLLLTIVSCPLTRARDTLERIRTFRESLGTGARVLGAHIEGPYISAEQRGAHNPAHIRTAEPEQYEHLFDYLDVIRVVTAAPEIAGVLDLAKALRKRGVLMSIGHSNGSFADVKAAIEAGFSLVTHIYCVMSTLHRLGVRKIAGILEGALAFDELSVGVIGDGYHVPEGLIDVVLKAKPLENIFLTTDAIRASGLPDGEYLFGPPEDQHVIVVEDGMAKTADRKLYAGSTTSINRCLQFLVNTGNLEVHQAVRTATLNPARLLAIDSRTGTLEVGKKADIVIMDDNFDVHVTIVGGRVVYSNENYLG